MHRFLIPKSYYVPQGGERLLRPQHCAQSQKDENPIQVTGSTTDAKKVVMYWYQFKYGLPAPLDQLTNISNINVAPGYRKFKIY